MENQSNTSTEETPDPVIAALNVLIKAAIVGQKNGAYTLNEAATILESVKVIQEKFGKKEEAKEEAKEEVTEKVKNEDLSKIDEE
jgi:hypothetical protein